MIESPAGAVSEAAAASDPAAAIRAAIALGIDITRDEMTLLQRAHHAGPLADQLHDDPLAVTASVDLAPELRTLMAKGSDQQLAACAGLHPAAAPELIARVLARSDVQILITSAPERLLPHVHTVLAARGSESARRTAARASEAPQVLEALAADADTHVRVSVAANPSAPPAVQATLAADRAPGVRAAIARRHDVAVELLAALVTDGDEVVRVSVATNRRTPPPMLEALAGDRSLRVREAVAGHPAPSPQTQRTLAADPEPRVRSRLAGNRSVGNDVLASLADDPDDAVRRFLARNPALSDPAVFDRLLDRVPHAALAANPSAPAELLRMIAERLPPHDDPGDLDDPHRTIARELAKNPSFHEQQWGRI